MCNAIIATLDTVESDYMTFCIYDAIGTVLSRDKTKVLPGKTKSVIFKRGHIIRRKIFRFLPVKKLIRKKNMFQLTVDCAPIVRYVFFQTAVLGERKHVM